MNRSSTKAFTLVELMLAAFLAMLIMASACGILVFTTKFIFLKTQESALQWEADVLMETLLRGPVTAAGNPVRGISEAIAHNFDTSSRLITFYGTDTVSRHYRLDGTGRSIIYNDGTTDTTIYTLPQGVNFQTMEITPIDDIALGGGSMAYLNWKDVRISITLSKSLLGTTVTGSLNTIVNLRNQQ